MDAERGQLPDDATVPTGRDRRCQDDTRAPQSLLEAARNRAASPITASRKTQSRPVIFSLEVLRGDAQNATYGAATTASPLQLVQTL
ncbi:hypothetical protein [Pseudoduganella lurida]|uniref:hypothetical protein n=1 Tax=Pseudoduganella lurida TaxID=1036180 RepID=UPI0011A46734|nr:hypothetical protein [Pseudoduganella lurida]